MHDSMLAKLEKLKERLSEIEALLIDSETIKDMDNYTLLNKEFADLKPIVEKYQEYNAVLEAIDDANEILESGDEDLKGLAEDELKESSGKPDKLEQELKLMLLPKDSADDGSAFLEIRAGAGGDEAGIFAGDLFDMYMRYFERQGYKTELITMNNASHGGYKEVSISIEGENIFGNLKFESGVHRVQRVPATESQGRVHTSAASVAVLPEAEEVDIDLNMKDVRRDTYRAQGAGGQHVNKTDSAIRITHIPSGIVVQCQNERSQHKNKASAMKVLKARLYQVEVDKEKEAMKSLENSKMDIAWGSQIRSYVFHPYNLVKDHRTKKESGNVSAIMDGDIDEFIRAFLMNQLSKTTSFFQY